MGGLNDRRVGQSVGGQRPHDGRSIGRCGNERHLRRMPLGLYDFIVMLGDYGPVERFGEVAVQIGDYHFVIVRCG